MEIGGHSVLPSTIKGVITSGPDTHVFIDMKIVLMMVTFRDQCPVQLEMWRPQQNPNQEREVTDVVRSVWTEVHEGIKLPTRIEGMQMSRFRTAELNATISWRLKDRVDKDFFDESTLGLLMPAFQSPN